MLLRNRDQREVRKPCPTQGGFKMMHPQIAKGSINPLEILAETSRFQNLYANFKICITDLGGLYRILIPTPISTKMTTKMVFGPFIL